MSRARSDGNGGRNGVTTMRTAARRCMLPHGGGKAGRAIERSSAHSHGGVGARRARLQARRAVV